MRVLVLAPFSAAGLARLGKIADVTHEDWRVAGVLQDPGQLGARLARDGFEALIVEADFLFAETFAAAPGIRFAGICRAALNQVDVEAATEHGVLVVNTPGRNANAVAELTIGLMLSLARRLPSADRYVRRGAWDSPVASYEDFLGAELSGRVAGVVGFGAIGRRVVELCRAFKMRVMVYDPLVSGDEIKSAGAAPVPLAVLLESSDFVTLHAPPPEDGTPLLGATEFARMRPSARVVNTSAWGLMDGEALYAALRAGSIAGAAFDVFETQPIPPSHPLLALDNVVLTPHIGGSTAETIERHSEMMAADLERYARGQLPLHAVNPEALQRAGDSSG